MKKIIYIAISVFLAAGLTSCDDWFDLKPQSETILEDYWQDENDVLSELGACYRGMNETGFMERLLVWGEVRSDNVVKGAETSGDLSRILDLTLTSANGYTSWGDFYKVINYCNTLIYYAPLARERDPNFTEGQLRAYIAEAKGIRALCYFTLLRTFRDIPLITDPVIDDTKPFEVPQSTPGDVLKFLIGDLRSVENQAVTGNEANLQYDKGRINQKAIWALLADMYLWSNNYDSCIVYCDKITAKMTELETAYNYNVNVFLRGNSVESIFELQFDDSNIGNYVVNEYYSGDIFTKNSNGRGNYKLSACDFSIVNLFATDDLRGKNAYIPVKDGSFFHIMKYVGGWNISSSGSVNLNNYYYFSNSSNWVFYRLPDIYLMKAEALVEKGELRPEFDLVEKTYKRARIDETSASLDFSKYNTQALMRNLVFDERQREFMFEGKRYFDLLRRINREGSPTNVVNTYLIGSGKYSNLLSSTVLSKINDMDAIYMPINNNEMKLNTMLVQNPFYVSSAEIEKN
jgi:hypothetical protein